MTDVTTWVERLWDGDPRGGRGVVSVVLLPLSAIFRIGVALRTFLFDTRLLRSHPPPIPVVSVGNLTVGGTGKTPVAAWLAGACLSRGVRPAVVLRGYGGDEVVLHERWTPGAHVVADADRRSALLRAVEAGAAVAILDDGFQHRRLERHLDLVLIAAEDPFPGRLLPAGRRREPVSALGRADLVIITRKSTPVGRSEALEGEIHASFPELDVARIHLRPYRMRTLADWMAGVTGMREAEGPFRVAAGVARPETVAAGVRALGHDVVSTIGFPDHHRYTRGEIHRLREGTYPLVVTEKDAVKIARFAPDARDIRVLEQEVVVEAGAGMLESVVDTLVGEAS
ncbi:MAG: tetraacyldisaccharide 4'-kinase [Longimicrobiales bacterium]|nr:tetraacyldisaccharide 4'-kinase [Longimicrobiales bacterium]